MSGEATLEDFKRELDKFLVVEAELDARKARQQAYDDDPANMNAEHYASNAQKITELEEQSLQLQTKVRTEIIPHLSPEDQGKIAAMVEEEQRQIQEGFTASMSSLTEAVAGPETAQKFEQLMEKLSSGMRVAESSQEVVIDKEAGQSPISRKTYRDTESHEIVPGGEVSSERRVMMRNDPVDGRPVNAIDVDGDGVVAATWGKEVSNYQLTPAQASLMMNVLDAQEAAGKSLMEYVPSNHLVDMVVALDTGEMNQGQFDQTISDLTSTTTAIRSFEKLDGQRGDGELSPAKEGILNRLTESLNEIPDTAHPTTTRPVSGGPGM